jgi:hypothetical protein
MSDYVIEVKDSQPNIMVRRDGSGALYEAETERDSYLVPPAGEYTLRIVGFAKPFEMTSEKYGTSTKTRIEFEIASEKGRGKRFTGLYTWTVGEKANLGKLIRRARGIEIPKGSIDVADLILPVPPIEFVCFVSNSDDLDDAGRPKYADVVLESVKAAGAERPAYDPFAA